MGRVIDVFNMLKQIKQNNSNNIRDDQILLTQFCNSHQDSIYIDNDSNLFLVYMNPLKSILVFSHNHNSFDKKMLLDGPPNKYVNINVNNVNIIVTIKNPLNVWLIFLPKNLILPSVLELHIK